MSQENKLEKSVKEIFNIEEKEFVSDCCSSKLIEEQEVCSECKEPCGSVETE